MQYKVVFDNASAGYTSWHFALPGLIGVAIGAILVAIVLRRGALPFPGWSARPKRSKIFAFFMLGFSLFWTVTAFYSTYHQYSTLANARANGTAPVVEGIVTGFTPMPVTGHAMERFCVSGQCFEYSDYVINSGFNNTSSHGGPIREGLPVRITYLDNTILKLEIGQLP
jgi:hypothetical protein